MLLHFCRFSQLVTAVATLCALVSLMKLCSCATDESDEVLDKKQLTEFYSKLIHLCCCMSKTSCCTFWWDFSFNTPIRVTAHNTSEIASIIRE